MPVKIEADKAAPLGIVSMSKETFLLLSLLFSGCYIGKSRFVDPGLDVGETCLFSLLRAAFLEHTLNGVVWNWSVAACSTSPTTRLGGMV
jgi:hypothetical protein